MPQGPGGRVALTVDDVHHRFMAQFVWKPQFVTGFGRLDAQHRRMFEVMNELRGALDTDVGGAHALVLIAELRSLTSRHFDEEEAVLRDAAYPDLTAIEREHAVFRAELDRIACGTEASRLRRRLAVGVVSEWLVRHTIGTDLEALEWVARQRAGAAAVAP